MPKITVQKVGGNDAYSWAVLRDGRPMITGLSQNEAAYHQRKIRQMYEQKEEK